MKRSQRRLPSVFICVYRRFKCLMAGNQIRVYRSGKYLISGNQIVSKGNRPRMNTDESRYALPRRRVTLSENAAGFLPVPHDTSVKAIRDRAARFLEYLANIPTFDNRSMRKIADDVSAA
jgi:hypothetical protein